MQLTLHTDYAIRILLYTLENDDRLVNITEIADFYQVSRNHVAKVVAHLTQKGYLQGVRGKGGGLKLALDPTALNVGELVEALEPLEIVECFGTKGDCTISKQCHLKGVIYKAKQAFLDVLKAYSLADLKLNIETTKETTSQVYFLPRATAKRAP